MKDNTEKKHETHEEQEELEVEQEKEASETEPEINEREALEQKCAEFEDRYKRVLADYQNLEKRSSEQRTEWIRSASRDVILRILPVLDTLLLAQQHSPDQSLKVCAQQFLDVLKAEGVTRIETVGKTFDPHLMEVVAIAEGDDPSTGSGQDIVVEEMRAGYMLNDKLLRPAQVKVGSSEKN